MSGRFRPTDAFVDESVRGQRYLMGCVLIEARDLPTTRAAIGALPTCRDGGSGDGLAECHAVAVRAVADYLERFGATTRVRSTGHGCTPTPTV